MAAAMDLNAVSDVVNTAWGQELVDELGEYITILCLSPALDPDWDTYLRTRLRVAARWC